VACGYRAIELLKAHIRVLSLGVLYIAAVFRLRSPGGLVSPSRWRSARCRRSTWPEISLTV